jgi:hypothetical protein
MLRRKVRPHRIVLSQLTMVGHALMVTLLEDLAELTYTHGLLTLVGCTSMR